MKVYSLEEFKKRKLLSENKPNTSSEPSTQNDFELQKALIKLRKALTKAKEKIYNFKS